MKLYLAGAGLVALGVMLAYVLSLIRFSGAVPISAIIASIGAFLIMLWFVKQVTLSIRENKQ